MTPWTVAEKALVSQHYRASGTRLLRHLLPGRRLYDIRQIANSMGLKYSLARRNGRAKQWTDAEDALIRKHYHRIRKRSDPMTINQLARMVNASPLQARYRAVFLGLLRQNPKQPDWTEAEDEFLAQNAGRSIDWLKAAMRRRGWPRRSEAGIATRRKRLGCSVVGNGSVYSANEFGRLIGTSSRTVTYWIKKGMLKATPRTDSIDQNHGGVGDRWEITNGAARNFIFKHTAYIDLGAVDKYWFIGLMEPIHNRPILMQSSSGLDEE